MRPLRSLLIGDVDFYPSEYIFGVAQGMALLGHWHNTVNIRADLGVIKRRLDQVCPDVIWGHMLLWAPGGQERTGDLLELCASWRRRGAKIIMHDGDARTEARFPANVSWAVDLALCNHTSSREVWGIQTLRWPYFAFAQRDIAAPREDLVCDLLFAGRRGGGIYTARTAFLEALAARLGSGLRSFPTPEVPHTLMLTPEMAASAAAILGYGRPEQNGWLDVRIFQYPGAGGVLLHDDAAEVLEPYKHYIPYKGQDLESALEALGRAKTEGEKIRQAGFVFVQREHSSVPRVRQALLAVGIPPHQVGSLELLP